MSLLQRLRSLLGLDGAGKEEIEEPPAVTVEHPREEQEPTAPDSPAEEPESTTPVTDAETPGQFEHDGPTTEISGIGPAYSDRLSDAGIDSIGELAAADPSELAEELDLTEGRVSAWIEDARDLAATE